MWPCVAGRQEVGCDATARHRDSATWLQTDEGPGPGTDADAACPPRPHLTSTSSTSTTTTTTTTKDDEQAARCVSLTTVVTKVLQPSHQLPANRQLPTSKNTAARFILLDCSPTRRLDDSICLLPNPNQPLVPLVPLDERPPRTPWISPPATQAESDNSYVNPLQHSQLSSCLLRYSSC